MTRMGDEMILNLAASLKGFDKTAAKDDDKEDKACAKCGKKDCPCGCDGDPKKCKCEKEDKKDKKDDKKDKKEAGVMEVLEGLSKLAHDFDELGADDASAAVDDALRVIVQNLKKKVTAAEEDEVYTQFPQPFEDAPWRDTEYMRSQPVRQKENLKDKELWELIQNADPSTLAKITRWLHKEMSKKYPEMDKGVWSDPSLYTE